MSDIQCIACQENIYLPENLEQEDDNFVICPHCQSIFEIDWDTLPVLTWAKDPIVTASFHSYRKYIF